MLVPQSRLPGYFYPTSNARGVHPARWVDPFLDKDGDERRVLLPEELRARSERNAAYRSWLSRRGLKGKQMIWQSVQIMRADHSERSSKDWWPPFQDALFRVFVQPEYIYCDITGEFKGWYVLCPEDSELVRRYLMERKGFITPPRDALLGERWVSKNKAINQALVVPVECCRHFRHETTAGELPTGL